jgi:hypothetical protein
LPPRGPFPRAGYWDPSGITGFPPSPFAARGSGGYLTFELDPGGLNNIRMQLEYLALLAAITGRTLVLPPPEGWYLINWGPMTREGDPGGVSHHGEFFDLAALARWIDVVTTSEFVDREGGRLGIPREFTELARPVPGTEKTEDRAGLRRAWTAWQRKSFRTIHWNPWFNVLFVPDIESVLASTRRPDDGFMDGRVPVAIDGEFIASPVVHFPCDVDGLRQLGQISKCFVLPEARQSIHLWKMLQYGVRYVPRVFQRAEEIIRRLGPFRYSSLHLRRNDFQYEVSRVAAPVTADTVNALLAPGEPLYIATDETDEAFFELIAAQRPVHRYADVEAPGRAAGNDPARKLTGCVEQLICAAGRRFIGTPHSSFSTYISRIRGYIGAPDLRTHDHTSPPGGEARQFGFTGRTLRGRTYMSEDRVLWEDADMDQPFYSVVCTDTQDYAHWQCELLEYTWTQVAQRGDLLRLVSRRTGEALPRHAHMQVIPTAYTNLDPVTGDEYAPYNRLFSFREWLEGNPDPGTVLVLDPDCVFRDRLALAVTPGAPIGQHWGGFALSERWGTAIAALSPADPGSIQGITWPALIHTDDLRSLVPRWIELTAELRHATGAWESDMMALVVAAAELKLRFRERHLAAVMNFPEEGRPAPIIHYCQAVEAKDGSRLWYKQGYRPWEPTGVDPADAKLDYCGDLIAILDEFVASRRQQSKTEASTATGEPALDMPDRFLVKVSLSTNAMVELDCRKGDPVLADLFTSLVRNSANPGSGEGKMLRLATSEGNEAYFHSSQIVSIETIPAGERH